MPLSFVRNQITLPISSVQGVVCVSAARVSPLVASLCSQVHDLCILGGRELMFEDTGFCESMIYLHASLQRPSASIWPLQLLQLSCASHSRPRYNCDNGGPAPEKLTNQIFQNTKSIAKYYIASDELTVDISKIGTSSFMVQHHDTAKFGDFTVKVRILQQPAMTADCGTGPKRWPRKLSRDLHSAAACAHLKVRLRLALHV